MPRGWLSPPEHSTSVNWRERKTRLLLCQCDPGEKVGRPGRGAAGADTGISRRRGVSQCRAPEHTDASHRRRGRSGNGGDGGPLSLPPSLPPGALPESAGDVDLTHQGPPCGAWTQWGSVCESSPDTPGTPDITSPDPTPREAQSGPEEAAGPGGLGAWIRPRSQVPTLPWVLALQISRLCPGL